MIGYYFDYDACIELQKPICAWLEANNVVPGTVPVTAKVVFDNGSMTLDVWLTRDGEKYLEGGEPARGTLTVPVLVEPSAEVMSALRPLATGGVVGPASEALALQDGGCVMPTLPSDVELIERIRQAMATQRITVLPPSESEREQAAHERGVAEGLRRAVAYVAAELGAEVPAGPTQQQAEAMLWAALDTARGNGRRQATEGWERRWNVDEPVDGLLWGEAGISNETSVHTALKQCRPGARVVSRLVGPWEAAEQTQDPNSPAAKMRSLRAHPHGSACICDDCTARDEAEADAAHMAAMEERHQHEDEQDGDGR